MIEHDIFGLVVATLIYTSITFKHLFSFLVLNVI
jgi:hypothetical protein